MILLAFLCALVITAVCLSLIMSNNYHDGFIGRVGLSLIAVGMGIGIVLRDVAIWFGETGTMYEPSRAEITFILGFAVFMVRHLHRFLAYCRACEYGGERRRQTDQPPKFSLPADASR